MSAASDLPGFYDRAYSREGEEGERLARWRALSAVGKADHVLELGARLGLVPERVLEVGCGDGALLPELGDRRFAPPLAGVEISAEAAALARRRGLDVEVFDGAHIQGADT